MWKFEVTRSSKATKEQIWSVWTDVDNWSLWDVDVENSSIFGLFEVGTFGELKAKSGPISELKLLRVLKIKNFTNRSKLPFCTLDFFHEITETDNSILVTHKIEINGLLTPLFFRIIGKQQAKNLPYAVESLIKLEEDGK